MLLTMVLIEVFTLLILIEDATSSFTTAGTNNIDPLLLLQIEQDGCGRQHQEGTPILLSSNTVAAPEGGPTIDEMSASNATMSDATISKKQTSP